MTIKEALEYKGHIYIGEEEVNIAKHEKGKYILDNKNEGNAYYFDGSKKLGNFHLIPCCNKDEIDKMILGKLLNVRHILEGLLKKKDGWSLKKCEGKVKYYGNLFNYLRASTGNCNYDLMFFRMALNKNEQQVECVLKSIQFACNNNITYSYELYPESTKNGDGKIDESGTNIYYNPHVNFYDSEMEICNAFMDFIELNELKAKHKSNLLEGEIKK